jgi:hypothetical protein
MWYAVYTEDLVLLIFAARDTCPRAISQPKLAKP